MKHQSVESNQRRRVSYAKTGGSVKRTGHDAENVWAEFIGGVVRTGHSKPDVVKNGFLYSVKKGKNVQMLLKVLNSLTENFGDDNPMIDFFRGRSQRCDDETSLKLAMRFANWLKDEENFRRVLSFALSNNREVHYLVDMIGTDFKKAYLSPIADVEDYLVRCPKEIITYGASVITKVDNRSILTYEWRSGKQSALFKMYGVNCLVDLIRKQEFCQEFDIENAN